MIHQDVYLGLGRELAARGAGWLTLPPRYARQKFSGVPRYAALTELVRAVSVPVIASGTCGEGILEQELFNDRFYAYVSPENPLYERQNIRIEEIIARFWIKSQSR